MKKFKFTLLSVVLLPLFVSFQTMAREKYRIKVQKIEGVVKYIPQIKRSVPQFYAKHWVDISNQPLSTQTEAERFIIEEKEAENLLMQNNKSTYIYIK
jgi:hypothetical protein